mmetsp:Transcript_13566/g.11631  ORF Transcript_13566/g.11631 Transcript_13566/m.11631 type:complete len:98 (-) Transcript_13566:408-701(-)
MLSICDVFQKRAALYAMTKEKGNEMTAILEDSREYLPSTILEVKSPNQGPIKSNLSMLGILSEKQKEKNSSGNLSIKQTSELSVMDLQPSSPVLSPS